MVSQAEIALANRFPLVQLPKKFWGCFDGAKKRHRLAVSISSTSEEVLGGYEAHMFIDWLLVSISSTSEEVLGCPQGYVEKDGECVSISSTSEEVLGCMRMSF